MYTVGAQHFGNLTSGDWMWVRKGYHSTLTNDMFGSREPYRFIITKTKYCLYLSPEIEYVFTAYPCSSTAQYICEKNQTTKRLLSSLGNEIKSNFNHRIKNNESRPVFLF